MAVGLSRPPDRVDTYADRHLTAAIVASRRGERKGAGAGIGLVEATTLRIVALLRAAMHRDQLAAGCGEHFAVFVLVASAVARCEPRDAGVGRARPVRARGVRDYRGGSGSRRGGRGRRLVFGRRLRGDLRTTSDEGDHRQEEPVSVRHGGFIAESAPREQPLGSAACSASLRGRSRRSRRSHLPRLHLKLLRTSRKVLPPPASAARNAEERHDNATRLVSRPDAVGRPRAD